MLRVLHLIDAWTDGPDHRDNDMDAVATLRRETRGRALHAAWLGGGAWDARRAASRGLRADGVVRVRGDSGATSAARAVRALERSGVRSAQVDVIHAWSARLAIAARALRPDVRVIAGAHGGRPIDPLRLSAAARAGAREALGIEPHESAVSLLPAWRGDADAARFGLAVGMAAFAIPGRSFVALAPESARWLERALLLSGTTERLWRFVIHDEPPWVVAGAADLAACVFAPAHAQRREPRCEETALAWSLAAGTPVVSERAEAIPERALPDGARRAVVVSREPETLSIGLSMVEEFLDDARGASARRAAREAVLEARSPRAWADRLLRAYEGADEPAALAVQSS